MVVDSFKQSSCTSDVSLIESHVRALTYLISFLVDIIIFDCFCAGLLLLDIATLKKSLVMVRQITINSSTFPL